jgi:4'-phosphopantetheinyl transferase
VLSFYFVRDAKTALASHVLKRLAVHVGLGVPWDHCRIVPNPHDENGKPVYVSNPNEGRIAFNVSHQAGVVALAAVVVPNEGKSGWQGRIDVGVDVVCTSERRDRDRKMVLVDDYGSSDGKGWARFVEMHADVLSKGEVQYLESGLPLEVPNGSTNGLLETDASAKRSLDSLDRRLRYFYALWCLREAYVKMTGEALLAPWLGELEFRNFEPPPVPQTASSNADHLDGLGEVGEAVKDHDMVFRGKKVTNVQVSLRALGSDYMLCTAVRTPENAALGLGLDLGTWDILTIDRIVELADAS